MIDQIDYMDLALKEAVKAEEKKEVPVGAIIVNERGEVIAKAHNLVETKNNATCHAEKLVIEKALKIMKSRYLDSCDLWVTLEPCVMCAGLIKQTRIKRLYYGKLDIAKNLLGRNWGITGIVIKGKQQGRELGFPTANVDMKTFLKPPFGVYVTRLKIINDNQLEKETDWLPSISNIGTRPTVSDGSVNIETHVIDFKNNNTDTNLYGNRVKVELLSFIRQEKKFNSLDELKEQISIDTKKAIDFHKLK
ncbi:deaminase [Alphaproteobacteria bacterium]|nr:deaminase [Alphaproteobacteria bacterium]